jgi:hypothetical protein
MKTHFATTLSLVQQGILISRHDPKNQEILCANVQMCKRHDRLGDTAIKLRKSPTSRGLSAGSMDAAHKARHVGVVDALNLMAVRLGEYQ